MIARYDQNSSQSTQLKTKKYILHKTCGECIGMSSMKLMTITMVHLLTGALGVTLKIVSGTTDRVPIRGGSCSDVPPLGSLFALFSCAEHIDTSGVA